MAIAGSPAEMPEQWTLGLVALHQSLYSLQADMVDQACFAGYAAHGSVLAGGQEAVGRARLLGQRVADQLGQPLGQARFLGDAEEGSCPYCHLLAISFLGGDRIMCTVCGARGRLSVSPDGGFRPEWAADSGVSHLTLKGKRKHIEDLMAQAGTALVNQEAQERYEYWKQLDMTLV